MNESERKEKKRVTVTSVVASVLLTLMKLAAGIFTGSLGLMAEAAHSGLDLVSTVITFFSVRIAGRPADEDHPYGHGRAENLSAIIQGALLLVTAAWIMYESVLRIFFENVRVEPSVWAFGVMATSIVMDLWRSRMLLRVAKKYRSRALEADALNFRADLFSSFVVIIGLALVAIANVTAQESILTKADAIAALVVGGFIIYKSGEVLLKSVNILLDRAPVGLQRRMQQVAGSVPGVVEVPSVRLRESGNKTFADVVVSVPRTTSAAEAHEVTEKVEQALRDLDASTESLVHVEPVADETETVAEAVHATALKMGIRTHHEKVWHSGDKLEAALHVEVDPGLSLEEAHDEARRLGEAIRNDNPRLSKVSTHIEVAEPEPAELPEVTADHPHLVEEIKRIVSEAGEGVQAHEVRLYQSKKGRIDTVMHCNFPSQTNMSKVHECTEAIEQALRQNLPQLGNVVIHAEPQ